MILQQLQEKGAHLGFQIYEKVLIGVYRGYPFQTAVESKKDKQKIVITFNSVNVNGKLQKDIKAHPKNVFEKMKVIAALQNHIGIQYTCQQEQSVFETMMGLLDLVIDCMLENEKLLPHKMKCCMCGKENCDSAVMNTAYFDAVHEQCAKKEVEKQKNFAVKNANSGNILTGFLGALGGALVGALPNLVLMMLLKVEYGWLYFLIPVASYQGYKMLNGKLGFSARIVVFVASVFGFFAQLLLFLKFLNFKFSFLHIIRNYFFRNSLIDILLDNAFGLVFFCIGLVVGIAACGETSKDILKQNIDKENSLQHLDGSPVMKHRDIDAEIAMESEV